MSPFLNPYLWLGLLLSALALFGGGYAAGNKAADNACIAEQAKGQQIAQTKVEAVDTKREEVAASREVSREQIRIVYRTIREKKNEIQVNASAAVAGSCDLSADGLRLWNAANAGATETLRGQPDYSLSSAASGTIRASGGLVAKPHRGDGALRAVPRSDEQVDGVRE